MLVDLLTKNTSIFLAKILFVILEDFLSENVLDFKLNSRDRIVKKIY